MYYTLISCLSFHYSNLYFNRLHFQFLFSSNYKMIMMHMFLYFFTDYNDVEHVAK